MAQKKSTSKKTSETDSRFTAKKTKFKTYMALQEHLLKNEAHQKFITYYEPSSGWVMEHKIFRREPD